jgi:hypothetical protein
MVSESVWVAALLDAGLGREPLAERAHVAVIRRILTHLGLPTEAAAPRPPPSDLFDWS